MTSLKLGKTRFSFNLTIRNNYEGEYIMKALFLAGGMGTRLRPITDDLPKPMVPMMIKPLLESNILKLKECGVDEVVLSTCYKSEVIEEHFGDGTKIGLKINYLREETPLGTGGAIKIAEDFFKETFIIFNADILCDIDILEMMRFHKEKKATVTIATTKVSNPSEYGVIEYDKNLYAETFTEKPKPSEVKSNLINAGIYIFEPNVLTEIPASKNVSIERETFPLLLEKGYPIAVFQSDAYWIDIGNIGKYMQAHNDILSGACPFPGIDKKDNGIFIGENSTIHKTVKLISPVYIGEGVEIEAFATIGPNAVIGNNCVVDENCRLSDSILWDGVLVPSDSILAEAVIVSNEAMLENTEEKRLEGKVS